MRILVSLISLSALCNAATLTVDLNGGGSYIDIQTAIDAAADGDTVLVMPGEYVITEPIDFNRLHDPEDPASPPVKNITLRSEDGAEATTIRMAEEPADPNRASVVIFECGESELSRLEGFKLCGGKGTLRECPGRGGGVHCYRAGPTFTDCTITGNTGWEGAGVFCLESSPRFTGCAIAGNATESIGGGLACLESSPILTDCTIAENASSVFGAGVLCLHSSPTLIDCTIARNVAQSAGGGVVCFGDSSPTFTGCTIRGNTAHTVGGGMASSTSSPTLVNCTIAGNVAVEGVGGLDCDKDSSPTLKHCIVWDNASGALHADDLSSWHITFSCIEGAEVCPGEGNIKVDPLFCAWDSGEVWVDDQGGFEAALHGFSLALSFGSPCLGSGEGGADMGSRPERCGVRGSATRVVHLAPGTYGIEGLSLAHRASLRGAGEGETVIEGTVFGLRTGASLSRLTVTSGTKGGIVVGRGEAPEISHSTITGNAAFEGGGIYCHDGSFPTLIHCTIVGNNATLRGGGVFCERSSPRLTECTIAGNAAPRGGGAYCTWDASPTLVNCAISGNVAESGGGVFCLKSSPTLTNCTMTGNVAESGGGVDGDDDSSPVFINSILWGNGGGALCVSSSRVAFSCIEGDDAWPGEGNINSDPLFTSDGIFDFERWSRVTIGGEEVELPDFIIEAPDHHLQPESPAIDAGTPEGAPTTDMGGQGRPCGAGVDMGAYEAGGCPPPDGRFVRGNVNVGGSIDIGDAIFVLNYIFADGRTPTCLDAADANDDGQVNIADPIYLLDFVFAPGSPPPPPFPDCGIDPTVDDLDCALYAPCQQ